MDMILEYSMGLPTRNTYCSLSKRLEIEILTVNTTVILLRHYLRAKGFVYR